MDYIHIDVVWLFL